MTAPARRAIRVLVATSVVAGSAAAVWVVLAAVLCRRGLGLANEGFYLLAYTRWDQDPRTFTGAQYLYGPLFELLGHDIGALRLARLASVVAVHLFLGIAFARWLRLQRPEAPASRSWECAVASLVLASGAMLYGWLPPTPGYNDVTLLGTEVLVALLLVGLRAAGTGRRVPLGVGLGSGLVAGAIVLAKPPAVVPLLLIVAASACALRLAGARLGRVAFAGVTGLVLFAAGIQLVVEPWSQIAPPLREQISIVSGSTHAPLEVLGWYAESSVDVLRAALLLCAPTALAALVARAVPSTSPSRRAALAAVGLMATAALLAGVGGLRAGGSNVLAFASGIVACLLLVVASTTALRRLRRPAVTSYAVVLGLLGLVPLLQGVGTNNALYAVGVNGTGLWVALMLALVTARPGSVTPRRVIAVGATLMSVALAVVVGIDGVTHEAGRTNLLTGPVSHVAGAAELSTISLPTSEAHTYSRMRSELGISPGSHRPMLAFGDLAQYVLILGGRPIGEAWYSADDDGLNAADLRAACRHGNPWGDEQPLVVANRDPSPAELAAWRACGIDFATDYRDVTPASAPTGLRILRSDGPGATHPHPALPVQPAG